MKRKPMRCHLRLLSAVLVISATLMASVGWALAVGLNANLVGLADNTWLRMNPNYEPVARSYSGIVYGNGHLYYYGGAHATYQGNDVEMYDIATNTWSQSYAPEWRYCDGGGGETALSPLGRPQVEHTYQYLSWDPNTRRYVGLLTPGFWAFDPANMGWTALAGQYAGGGMVPGVPGSTGCRSLTAWDNDLGGFIAIVNCTTPNTYVWRNQTQGWVALSTHPILNCNQVYSAYAPDRHLHLVTDEVQWWTYEAASDRWTRIADPPTETVKNMTFDYDSRNRVFIGMSMAADGTIKVWLYDVDQNQWALIQQQSTGPVRSAIFASWTKQLLRYDPISNVFIFLNSMGNGAYPCGGFTTLYPGTRDTWAYRYRGAPSTDVTVPSPIQDLRPR